MYERTRNAVYIGSARIQSGNIAVQRAERTVADDMGYRFAVRRGYMLDRIRQNGRRFINMKRLFLGIIILLSVCRVFGEDAADKMILVKGGTYTNPRGSGETKRVKLTDFYISAVQVTVGDYQAYLRETDPSSEYLNMEKLGRNYEQPVTVSFPMGYITWFDALEYCNWLSKKRGYRPVYEICAEKKKGNYLKDKADYPADALVKWDKEADGYRLATVAEWEYAASARGTNFDYGSAKSPSVLDEAWLYENANFKFHPVGLKKPNALGLYDMLGNMFEWCWDSAETPEERKYYYRATKGSSYDSSIAESSMLWRSSFSPLRIRYSTHGFRLVRSVPEVSKSRQGLFGSRYSAGKRVYAADNLNIRAAPNVRGEKVVLAGKGSPLTVLEEGKKETIDGITAPWIKVRLPDGKEGWCFAGYVAVQKP